MNPNNEQDRSRLFRAMETSYRHLEPFRNLVHGLVEEYAGAGYGNPGRRPRHESLLNLLNQAVDAYTMSLAANCPRVLVTTTQEHLAYFARHFQEAINNLVQEIGLEYTLRQAVLDAFFCVGVVKLHLADSVEVEVEEGLWMDPGLPFASNVSLDNWVHDMSATRFDRVKFAADCYRIPFADMQSDIFDQAVAKKLSPTSKSRLGNGDERLENISRGEETDSDDVEPMIDLMDVWVPRDRKIYTFAMDATRMFSGTGKAVAVMDWDGPELGPYELLSFNDVPENIMPTSPASHLSGLARLANNLMRKQSKDARKQRTVQTFTPAGAPDAKAIQRSDDDWVPVHDVTQLASLKIGGIDQANQAFLLGVMDMFDRMAGNLTAIMGLGAQADTVGQEQLIHSAASRKEASMQYRVFDFTRRVTRGLGFMLWTDQAKVIPGKIPIDGASAYEVDATWTPEDREGDFSDYDLEIDVHSMAYQSPAQKVNAISQLLTQIYAPLAQLLMSQGGQINLQKLTDLYAEALNLPKLREVVQFTSVPPDGEPSSGSSTMPQATSREYIRRSVPTQGSPQGRSQVMQQALLSAAAQQSGQGQGFNQGA